MQAIFCYRPLAGICLFHPGHRTGEANLLLPSPCGDMLILGAAFGHRGLTLLPSPCGDMLIPNTNTSKKERMLLPSPCGDMLIQLHHRRYRRYPGVTVPLRGYVDSAQRPSCSRRPQRLPSPCGDMLIRSTEALPSSTPCYRPLAGIC